MNTLPFATILMITMIIIIIIFMVIIFMFTQDEAEQFYLFASLTFITIIFFAIMLMLYQNHQHCIRKPVCKLN